MRRRCRRSSRLRARSRGRGAETGDKQGRDAQLAHLVDLHKRAVSPQIAQMKQLLIERISITSGFIQVWYSLEPWGSYKTYLFCRVCNPDWRTGSSNRARKRRLRPAAVRQGTSRPCGLNDMEERSEFRPLTFALAATPSQVRLCPLRYSPGRLIKTPSTFFPKYGPKWQTSPVNR